MTVYFYKAVYINRNILIYFVPSKNSKRREDSFWI